MLNDNLANALGAIYNSEKAGKEKCIIRPLSKVTMAVLGIMKEHNYIRDLTEVKDRKGGLITVSLAGNINKCGVIKPRFSVKTKDFEIYEKRFLPSKDFGFLIVSTPKGIMTHLEAKEKGIGGRLIAYCY